MKVTHLVLLLPLLCILLCCKQENEQENNIKTIHNTYKPPVVTTLAALPDSLQPKEMLLANAPKPRVITVPTYAGGSYTITNGGVVSKINLEPPVNKLLPVLRNADGEVIKDSAGNSFILGDGGSSNFTTFTTDNGLALDAISCSIMDRAGNLWFGTDGGGVSRYDGKSFVTFSTAQGLADNIVNCICEDRTGNLWFGTEGGGVSRYDGKRFTTFSAVSGLANNSVRSICEDKTGKLWFGTYKGVSRYDPSALSGTGVKSFVTFSTAQGLVDDHVWGICEDKTGNLWFGTSGGVIQYNGKSFTTIATAQGLADNIINCICQDKSGNIWFGTAGGGVSRYDPRVSPGTGSKMFTTFTTAHGLANNNVRSICEDKTGNLWFGTAGGGVSRYDPGASPGTGSKTFSTFSTAEGLANNNIWSICKDKTGNLWFSTHGGGVIRYGGKSFVTFSTAQGLAGNSVWSMADDKTGNLWFGTYGDGVSCYNGNGEAITNTNRNDKNEVRKSFLTFSTAQGLADNTVWSICEDKTGNLWFGTEIGGVSRYDPGSSPGTGSKTFTTFSTAQGLSDKSVRSIAEDKTGKLWFGTFRDGVSCYDPGSSTTGTGSKMFTTFTTAQGLANNTVWCIHEDKTGNLWFGTDGGVSCYDGKSFVTFSTAQGLANNTVWNICEDKKGNLWFATSEGLSVMSVGDVRKLPALVEAAAGWQGKNDMNRDTNINATAFFKTFTKTDGLPDNFVSQVIQMPDGKMAVGTNLGITFFNPSDDLTKLNNIECYNSNTGYPVKDVNTGQNCMLLDRKGVIWAATGNAKTALVRFDPSALLTNRDAPTLVIKGIKINAENICWHDLENNGKKDSNATPAYITEEITSLGKILTDKERDTVKQRFRDIQFNGITPFYPTPLQLVLPYKYNHITIDFNAIETDKPNLVNYRYMLEGYDKDWSPVLKNTSATFGNINEGSYTFKVKAQSPTGVWCEPVTYSFSVLPPWYRTWWAYVLYVISAVFVLYVIYRWRVTALIQHQKELEQTVIERTAEVVAEKKEVEVQREEAVKQYNRSEELLLNILPSEIAEELKDTGKSEAKTFNNVTVLFTDFKGFTTIAEKMSAKELVEEIDCCFKAFDQIIEKYNIEKIKTIGDSYMAVGGLPVPNTTHATDVVNAAIEIRDFMLAHKEQKLKEGKEVFEIRIGIHSGQVVAGIVGLKKFAYDIWGDTVNTASRIESSGEEGKVNISTSTYELVKNQFTCTYRGKIEAKKKGFIDMYFVEKLQ